METDSEDYLASLLSASLGWCQTERAYLLVKGPLVPLAVRRKGLRRGARV
jgi:hypothetical protein